MTTKNAAEIISAAYCELINQGCKSFPINPQSFWFPNREIIIDTYERYACLGGTTAQAVMPYEHTHDGYVTRQLRPGINLILYNRAAYNERMRFTLLHEIAHVRLGHPVKTLEKESEAHFFAAEAMVPDLFLIFLQKQGYRLTPRLISAGFGTSIECAERKMEDLEWTRYIRTPYDAALYYQFQKYLLHFFPRYCNKSAIEVI